MQVNVTALGGIKEFIPSEKCVELDQAVTLDELKVLAGIPSTKNVSYAVNGRVQRGDYVVADCDSVKFIMLAGAG